MPGLRISNTPLPELATNVALSPTPFLRAAGSAATSPERLLARDSIEQRDKHAFHLRLSTFNARRLLPAMPRQNWSEIVRADCETQVEEGCFVEQERSAAQRAAAVAPTEPSAFARWFEQLRETGPGQGDALFPWLADCADLSQLRWFLAQEAAGEAGFEDLLAITQVRFPIRPKLEMARNYWDEMGRGHERGMHGPMLAKIVRELDLDPQPATTVWESLALANLMVALAANRRYAYHAIGALGVIELTAPSRVSLVDAGLKRLDISKEARMYFPLHATLDVKHSEAWNREVLIPLVNDNPAAATAIAEGALMRLASGARCFQRYRAHFGLNC